MTLMLSFPRFSRPSLRAPSTDSLGTPSPVVVTPSTPPAGGVTAAAAERSMRSQPCWVSWATTSSESTIAVSAPTPQLTVSASPSRAWMKSESPVQGSVSQTLSPSKMSSPAPPSR